MPAADAGPMQPHCHLPAPGPALPPPAPGGPQGPPLVPAPPGAPSRTVAAHPGRLCLGSARPRPASRRACGRKRLTVPPGYGIARFKFPCSQASVSPSDRRGRSDPLSTRCPETPASLGKRVQGPQEPDPIPRTLGSSVHRPEPAGQASQLPAEAELGLASSPACPCPPCGLGWPVPGAGAALLCVGQWLQGEGCVVGGSWGPGCLGGWSGARGRSYEQGLTVPVAGEGWGAASPRAAGSSAFERD